MLGCVVGDGERAREDAGLQAVAGVVDAGDGLFNRVVGDDREDRCERFVLDDIHVRRYVREDGRLVEGTVAVPAGQYLGTGCCGIFDPALDAHGFFLCDHRAEAGRLVAEFAALEVLGKGDGVVAELLVDAARDVDALAGDADLAGVEEGVLCAELGDFLDIFDVFMHDVGGV